MCGVIGVQSDYTKRMQARKGEKEEEVTSDAEANLKEEEIWSSTQEVRQWGGL